ncbi:MAG: class I SAM-dependent methyltransferase [Candidatus Staskawiczbacteria bacterium]|nr:class I SAM-dependent methyltransferase [Candidatus Staskawiczbacteria bacterium]
MLKKIKEAGKKIYRKLSPLFSEEFLWHLAQKFEKRFWNKWFKKNLRTMDKQWLDIVSEFFELKETDDFKNKILVDIGAGPIGILTRLNAKEKIAVDPLPIDSVDKSIRRIKSPGEEIPLKSDFADNVFLYNVLQHVIRPEKVLQEGTRILKPGGKFYILEQLNLPRDPGHPHSLKLEMFDKWIEENNFEIIKKIVKNNHSLGYNLPAPGTGYVVLCLIVAKK